MNKIAKRKSLIFISIGMFITAFAQILSQYVELSDLVKGSITGIGIGMLLIALTLGNFKSVHSN